MIEFRQTRCLPLVIAWVISIGEEPLCNNAFLSNLLFRLAPDNNDPFSQADAIISLHKYIPHICLTMDVLSPFHRKQQLLKYRNRWNDFSIDFWKVRKYDSMIFYYTCLDQFMPFFIPDISILILDFIFCTI